MFKQGFVYMMMNNRNTVIYIGVTSNLEDRVMQHRNSKGSVFTSKYNCVKLVYYEICEDILSAIDREKQLKKWNRAWKIELIKSKNPNLVDLSHDIDGSF